MAGAIGDAARATALSLEELSAFLEEVFPQAAGDFEVLEIAPYRARLAMPVRPQMIRPGGTVSGPTMFALADYGFYAAVLAMIGREALAVTTNLSINFMRKPQPTTLYAEVRLLKLGRSLAVGDALLFSEGEAAPVAHASGTYSIPPRRDVG